MEYFAYILLSVVILLVMVLIHELGHYTTAKILGFTVDEFAVGFGPRLFGRRRKNGEMFSLRMLPLGGFCSFYGERDDESQPSEKRVKKRKRKNKDGADVRDSGNISCDSCNAVEVTVSDGKPALGQNDPEKDDLLSYVMRSKIEEDAKSAESCSGSSVAVAEPKPIRLDKNGNPAKGFFEQKPWKRIIVLLGGVLFNFLSAIVFSFVFIWAAGYAVPQVGEVFFDKDGAQYCPDIRVGDIVIALNVNGTGFEDINIMNSYSDVAGNIKNGDKVVFKVLRNGSEINVETVCGKYEVERNGETHYYRFGFEYNSEPVYMGANIKNAFIYCIPFTGKMSWSILGVFGGLFTGKTPILESVSGPIGAITGMAKASMLNWRNILMLLPLIASNLAIFNLLPFPALDGAHVVFTVIEWIRKKPINRNVEGMIHFVGMVVLLLFVVIVDILHFAL